MTRKATIKQDDIKRVIKGCIAAGLKVGTVTVSPAGEIVVYAGGEEAAPRLNPLDAKLLNGA